MLRDLRDWFASLDPRLRKRLISLAIAAIAAAAGVTVVITDEDGDGRPDSVTIEKPAVPVAVGVAGPDSEDAKPDEVIELDREAREIVQNAQETPEQFDISGGLRGEDDTPVAEHEGPLATPSFPGCQTRILPTNWSNRTSTVKAIGLHYTAGGNRPGLSDMNGLTAYASSPSAGVSWHFLIDAEGHCYYSVPLNNKAWTIGNLNSQTVNIEVIGTGREKTYPAGSPGARKLAQVVQRLGRVYKIPMRLGAVSNCKVTKSGIITHWQGGACSGGHHDIRPYDILAVVRAIAAGGGGALSPKHAKWCRSHRIVHAQIRAGRSTAERRARNRTYHRLFERDKITCRA